MYDLFPRLPKTEHKAPSSTKHMCVNKINAATEFCIELILM